MVSKTLILNSNYMYCGHYYKAENTFSDLIFKVIKRDDKSMLMKVCSDDPNTGFLWYNVFGLDLNHLINFKEVHDYNNNNAVVTIPNIISPLSIGHILTLSKSTDVDRVKYIIKYSGEPNDAMAVFVITNGMLSDIIFGKLEADLEEFADRLKLYYLRNLIVTERHETVFDFYYTCSELFYTLINYIDMYEEEHFDIYQSYNHKKRFKVIEVINKDKQETFVLPCLLSNIKLSDLVLYNNMEYMNCIQLNELLVSNCQTHEMLYHLISSFCFGRLPYNYDNLLISRVD